MTVTLKVQAVFPPDPSIIVQLTVVMPTLNEEPLGGVQLAAVITQPSTGGRVQLTLALHWAGSILTVWSEGQVGPKSTHNVSTTT